MVADDVAGWLEEMGITHAFGIIGGGNVVLWDAIHRHGKTKIVCCHHEQAAVMAAAYYYRSSKRMAVALVTTGAGSSNAVTGLLAAQMDSIPTLVISGNEASKYMHKPTRIWGVQGYGSSELVEPIVKDSFRTMYASDVLPYLEIAHRSCLRPRQGACWVDIPKDIQSA